MKINLELNKIQLSNKDYMVMIINNHCIEKADEHFLGKLPGTRYKYQFYLSRALYSTEFLNRATEEFYEIIKKEIGHFDFQLAGQEFSSIPLLVGIPIILEQKYKIKINSFMIKNERKSYGINNYIEGMPTNLPVLIVGEMCNSTSTFLHCYNVLTSYKYDILPYIFAILNKHSSKISNATLEDKYLKNNFKPLTILNVDDLKNDVR